MKHLNPINEFEIRFFYKDILRRSERFSVKEYASLGDCAKSVRKRLKRAKTEGFKTMVYTIRQSGSVELLNTQKK